MTNTTNTIELLKKELEETQKYLNDISITFVNDNTLNNSFYFGDAFSEEADTQTSVYYKDQREFYNNNVEFCEDALKEYGYNLQDMFEDGMTLDDIVCKCGAIGEYSQNYNQLCEDEEDIKKCLILKYCIDNNINISLEDVEDIATNPHNDKTDYLLNDIEDLTEEEEENEE